MLVASFAVEPKWHKEEDVGASLERTEATISEVNSANF